ncbi:hypothetical protein CHL76_05920 [Marinococcus halophilus]|uniref:Protease PrsW n=1 Tax=Marinococcus halophilus TaxID=1371 RepID=A0A510Y3K6_MARHA|nr:glutamic-type intramembrane protease PrsW [Marinococcus halophilus]OZT80865.1 hypothetical protein CHL76_05920 [Marinococcus halophilus]GEK57920.1 protease PrsW [Marinococcus halophilus]
MIALIMAALAPAVALLLYFTLKRRADVERRLPVIRAFVIGVLIVFPVLVIEHALETEGVGMPLFAAQYTQAAVLEEGIKFFLLYTFVLRFAPIKNTYDGVIYGLSLSLGFASLENILYLIANGIETAVTRALLPVTVHALLGVIMGYYAVSAKRASRHGRRLFSFFLALAIPLIFHGLYDYILSASLGNILYYLIPFMLFLWWFALSKANKANAK